MSRGLGCLQKSIHEQVQQEPGVVVGKVRWEVAEGLNRLTSHGYLGKAYYAAFQRAVSTVCERGLVATQQRMYRDLDEIVERYQYRTPSLAIRHARKDLLPELRRLIRKRKPWFSPVQTERHILRKTFHALINARPPAGRADWGRACSLWDATETEIVDLLRSGASSCTLELVDLLIKGREYFGIRSRYRLDYTLRQVLVQLETQESQCQPTLQRILATVRVLLETWIPADELRRADLKNQLYHVVDFQLFHTPTLKEDVKYTLYRDCTDIVKSLPGHRERLAREGQYGAFSPVMDKILCRDVLRAETFLYPAMTG